MRAMKVIRNLLVIVGLMAVAGQAYAWGAPAETEYHHARYALQNDIGEGSDGHGAVGALRYPGAAPPGAREGGPRPRDRHLSVRLMDDLTRFETLIGGIVLVALLVIVAFVVYR